ncbi:MAG: hypothetical protein WC645_08425 [Candidatus Margulisiibacteriota bacterium]
MPRAKVKKGQQKGADSKDKIKLPGVSILLVPKLYLGTGMVAKLSLAGNAFPSQAWEQESKSPSSVILNGAKRSEESRF